MEQSVRIYLMRHAKTAESWRTALDAPLSETGHRQADSAAQCLAGLGPLPLWSSPLQRARQTAAPLASLWQTDVHIEPRITEIPAPSSDPKIRGEWLAQALTEKWSAMQSELKEWRNNVLNTLSEVTEDTVMVTHYVVVNAVVGAATGDDRVICFHPDNTDTTVIDKVGDRLNVVGYTLGEISDTTPVI